MEKTDERDNVIHIARRRPSNKVIGVLIVVVVALIVPLGVGVAAAVQPITSESSWRKLSNVGQSMEAAAAFFSALGLIAIVVTFVLQYKELQLQRLELTNQRMEMEQTRIALNTTAEASLRALHVGLIRISIDNSDLAAVWPPMGPDLPFDVSRQYLYANLIIQHQRSMLNIQRVSVTEVAKGLERLFESPIMREYWKTSAEARAKLVDEGSAAWDFEQMVDAAYRAASPQPNLHVVE